jgi:hypothetical protein
MRIAYTPRPRQTIVTANGHVGYCLLPRRRIDGAPGVQQLRAAAPAAKAIGVDREKNVLRGFVMAQLGPFKTPGRGEFDQKSLDAIVRLGNATPGGVRSRLNHATILDDGIGKFLGRVRNFRIDTATDARTGKRVSSVRGDLHFDATALDVPLGGGKPLGQYVMDLAASDPGALSSSLVLKVNTEYRLNADGSAQVDTNGEPLPPLWRPTELFGADIVDMGDAVDDLLSADRTPRLDQRRARMAAAGIR